MPQIGVPLTFHFLFCNTLHQCLETGAWVGSLPKSWENWLPMLGGVGCDRWKPGGSRTNITIGAIRLLRYEKSKYHLVQNADSIQPFIVISEFCTKN
jgi:hypothetical protein